MYIYVYYFYFDKDEDLQKDTDTDKYKVLPRPNVCYIFEKQGPNDVKYGISLN